MIPASLSAVDVLTPIAGVSMNVLAVAGISGAVILGVVWMALRGSGGSSD